MLNVCRLGFPLGFVCFGNSCIPTWPYEVVHVNRLSSIITDGMKVGVG